ncbi:HD domain-containing protein [Flavobacterium sp. J372]|uniref:HD domain-containing protein n=1 Tax=Flavobacterium sp. J372 TaxID=2898436 RepID=UPI0021507B41|nr:HD domain-containing protein [Flavobacterium sp. J372]MCR5862028.1 HD domain-containing protein [Flavobacterium sp. J372]
MQQQPECAYILQKLRDELPQHLTYHTLQHTMDVYHRCEEIAEKEGLGRKMLGLLLIAAVYHDAGYLYQRTGHEARSCEIAMDILPQYGYNDEDVKQVCRIIMATKLPQSPTSLAEQIICDADLDYLGRDDFFETGEGLYLEMLHAKVINNRDEWDKIQIQFLEQHHYFTATSQQLRNAKKQENLNQLKAKINR